MSKKTKTPEIFEVSMLEDGLDRLKKIGARQPLPTQHFYKELQSIVREAVVKAYEMGKNDGKNGEESFPVKRFQD